MKKILLAAALIIAGMGVSAPPATAHMDDWHQATCQKPSGAALWYYWHSGYASPRVTYWKYAVIDYVVVTDQFVQHYGETGYECGWLGEVRSHLWIQQVCEFGYCGTGAIQAFEHGYLVKHYGGYAAGWVAAYSW